MTVLDHLTTERLVLRRREVDDAAVVRQLWSERDPRVPARRHLDAEGRPSVDDIAGWIRAERDDPRPGVLSVVRRHEGDVIGYCGLVFHGSGDPDDPELAFELVAAAHGRGYATEAARAVVDWTAAAGYPRLWATVWDWNVASRGVLAKLGFRETGETETGEHGESLLTVLDL